MLDRIDIHIKVPLMDDEKISGDRIGELGKAIRARVQLARNIQQNVSRANPNQSLEGIIIL